MVALDLPSGVGGVIVHLRDPGQPPAREDLGQDELDEAQQAHRRRQAQLLGFLFVRDSDGVQQHPAVVGRQIVELLEEGVVALEPGVPGTVGEMLKRTE
ncbi:hypothetical protein NCGM2209_0891 [Mycobacterium tuberculosis NCGM2209]|nr:hypothetical protein NCGM2209_0891 [Mycobacterium tuberculosis NCGM2209]